MKKGRTAPGRGVAGKAGASKRPALPPPLPAPEELEDLAASRLPSLPAAWWVTHQVTEHVFSTVARTDSRTGDPLPQSLTELLSELNTATSTGCRPFPRDRLFDAALFAAEPFAQLLDHHRHRIIRTHEQLPFHRLREVDTRSLAWLARQPGRNVREKLSGRTHALGVKRDLTADTTENRLLRAFAKLVVHRATDRLAHAEAYDRAAPDMDRVSKLAEVARLCDERMRRSEIGDLPTVARVRPNNVLLSDPLYSRVYRSWKWLREAEDGLRHSWPEALSRARALLSWMVAARLAATPRVVVSDTLGRAVIGRGERCSVGLEVLGAEGGRAAWLLNPPLQFLVLPVGRDDSAFHIRLSLEGEFLLAHVAALEGRGVLRETSTSAIAFEFKPEPERLSVGRGLAILVDGIEGGNRGEAQGFADLAGLPPLAEQMTRQILARCAMTQLARKAARGLPRALAEAPRIGIELGSTSLRVSDGRPLPLATKGWTLALTLPGEVQGAEWLDGRGDRHVAIGETERSTWAMIDVLDPDTDADAGMLALAARRVVHGLAEELAAPASARVAYAVPDSIDEFSQRSIRGAVGASFSRAVPVWRSVAAALAWGSLPTLLPRGPRSGDPIVVVDTEFATATITVLVARHDDKVERLHPSSRGIYWERKPPLPPDEQLDMLGWSHVLHAYARALVAREAEEAIDAEQQNRIVKDLLRTGAITDLVERGGSVLVQVPSARRGEHAVLELHHDPEGIGVEVERWLDRLETSVEAALGNLSTVTRSAPVLIVGGPCAHSSFVLPERRVGRIKHFNHAKGYGFIAPEDGTPDVFAHVSSMQFMDGYEVRPGDVVELDVVRGAKGPEARRVGPVSRLRRWRDRRVAAISPHDVSAGARECLLRLDSGCTAWKEWLPDLSLEVVRDGHYGDLPLLEPDTIVDPFLGSAVEFRVPEALTLARAQPWYSFPLIVGKEGQRPLAWEARLESRAFPLDDDVRVSLLLSYQYGLEASYTLTVVPESAEGAPFSKVEARWVQGGNQRESSASNFGGPVPGPEEWTANLAEQLVRTAAHVYDDAADEWLERHVLPLVRRCWSQGRSLALAPQHVRASAEGLIDQLCRRLSDADQESGIPVAIRILALMHEDAPTAIAARVEALDDAAGDDRERSALVVPLLGALAGDGRPDRHRYVERLIRRLERFGSFEFFNPQLARQVRTALAVSVWRDSGLVSSLTDSEAGAIVSHVRRTLSDLLTRVPTTASTPEARETMAKRYGGPFRDACELLLGLVRLRGTRPVPSLACGTAVADSLAKAIRQVDARFARNRVDPRWRLRLDVEVPPRLRRMSRVAYTLNAVLSQGQGANLVHVDGSEEA